MKRHCDCLLDLGSLKWVASKITFFLTVDLLVCFSREVSHFGRVACTSLLKVFFTSYSLYLQYSQMILIHFHKHILEVRLLIILCWPSSS